MEESAISRRVRDLEDQLGASLFQRHSGGVCLTLAGQRFLRRIRLALRQIDDGAADVAAIGRSEHGRVRIGIYSSIASGFLAELLRAYGQRHVKVRIDLIDGNPAEHVAAIRQLRLDVAFLTGTHDWIDCEREPLWSERVFAALPDDHILASREELVWDDLAAESFIVSMVAPGQEIEVQQIGRDNLLQLVALGRGLTLVSEAMTVAQFPGISYRPIAGEVLPFSAVWSPRNDNPALRRFLSTARMLSR